MAKHTSRRLGIWLVGARGGVATTTIVGTLAIRRNLSDTTGMVTEMEDFHPLRLAPLSGVVFGGWEVRSGTLRESAQGISQRNGTLRPELLDEIGPGLDAADAWIRSGSTAGCGEAIEALANGSVRSVHSFDRYVKDLLSFRQENALDDVVVVNVASTEPPTGAVQFPALAKWSAFSRELAKRRPRLPASAVYAAAAFEAGCPYVNFTPSVGCAAPALLGLAREKNLPHMGRDGKTGETWVKTVLAPAFLARNLRVLSWEGHNILGDGDGKVLANPENARGKIADKDQALRLILQDPEVHSRVRIDYVPSLDDWKTAWDFIHFRGFLGVKMAMQFTWQGCDSILASPLVLDLARMAEFAHRKGEAGPMTHLACFFKSPFGVQEHAFHRQFAMLSDYAQKHRKQLKEVGGRR